MKKRDAPAAPPGQLIYAVGDIHGRADLLECLLASIIRDCRDTSSTSRPLLVFIGDYIDRGLNSRQVVDLLLALPPENFETVFLKGNHEAAMLTFLDRPEGGPYWFGLGGAETLFSYGVHAPPPGANVAALRFTARALTAAIPPDHKRFFSQLRLYLQVGDYLFVHAGLRPGEALERQNETDLLEIRAPFLKSRQTWPFTVVHGHTPVDDVARERGRIAIDTGAYATGKLSALRLQGTDMKVLTT